MLTPQEVSTHAFSKAVMGGYNMAMVDEFLDELTDDYTALYKENAALKAKLKVLVEKVEDYRATEDSMRATLLTAQKMADSIVHEAEAKRDEILAQAESSAREKIGQLQPGGGGRRRSGCARASRIWPSSLPPAGRCCEQGAEIPGAAARAAGGGGGARLPSRQPEEAVAADRGKGAGRLQRAAVEEEAAPSSKRKMRLPAPEE